MSKQDKPVAELPALPERGYANIDGWCDDAMRDYARAAIAADRAARPVLTDEQIMDIGREMFKAPRWPSTAIDFARAVLAATQGSKHG